MRYLLAFAVAAAGLASAQVAPMVTTAQPDVQRLVAVKHVQTSDPRVSALMNTLNVKAAGPIGGFIVINGPKEAVAAAEEVIQKLDVQKPEPDAELTGWILINA